MHQQNPSIPIDLRSARHITPLSVGIGSHDEYSAHVVDGGYDPTVLSDGDPIEAARGRHLVAPHRGDPRREPASAGRSPLWTLDLMIGRELDFIPLGVFPHAPGAGRSGEGGRPAGRRA